MAGENKVRAERDAIAEPWGSRTPYGAGEPWPVRVDMRLDEGVSPDDVDVWVQTASVLHSNGDAMDIAVAGRSEEHTSELQSRENLVCRLLLEKKKKDKKEET